MSKTIFWSQYETWLKCPQLWSYTYNDHLPKGEPAQPGSPLDLGIRIGKALANRLRDQDWKPTVGHNRNVGGLDGITVVLKEYDARYKSDHVIGPWRAEQPFDRVSEQLGRELSCVVDGKAGDLIRETKVTDMPNWALYRAQLLWNCFCAGVQQGQLDLIYRPGYHRPDWAFERKLIIFTEQDIQALIFDIEKFLDLTGSNQIWRNVNQCTWCPHFEKCWGAI